MKRRQLQNGREGLQVGIWQGLISTMYYCKDGTELSTHTSTAKRREIPEQVSPKGRHTEASKHMEEKVDLWLAGRERGATWLECLKLRNNWWSRNTVNTLKIFCVI